MVRVNGAIVSSESGDVLKISKPPLLFYMELHIFFIHYSMHFLILYRKASRYIRIEKLV